MERIRHIIKEFIFRRQDSCLITDIPSKILHVIFDFLSTPDQVCLSLSCKHLYAYYLSILDARGTSLHELFPHEIRPILCRNTEIENRPRIHLLRQLRNRRWEYCHECWNLHPMSAFYRYLLQLFVLRKTYPGNLQLYGRYGCMLVAGQVDICPCLNITFRDKLDLMEKIRFLKDPHAFESYYNKILRRVGTYPIVAHICKFDKHPLAKVSICTVLHICEGHLHLNALYQFEAKIFLEKTPQALCRTLKTTSICPFKNPKKWITQFFIEAGSDFFFGFPLSGDFKAKKLENRPIYSHAISVHRNLGLDKLPDVAWYNHNHY